MNKRDSQRLAKRIERERPHLRVTGTRDYGRGHYALDLVDTRSGELITVGSVDAWEALVAALDERAALVAGGATITDDFNRADSTNVGATWIEERGNWEILTNWPRRSQQ